MMHGQQNLKLEPEVFPKQPRNFSFYRPENTSRNSSVGIANPYGLEDPGIVSRLRRGFPHASRPELVPTQFTAQWVPGHFRE
jgi:hypothetical protein